MGKVINISSGNYSRLDEMRRLIPGKKAYESFNAVISRLLNITAEKENNDGVESDIHTAAEKD